MKIGPKYVAGVTKSQGDAQYESELRKTDAQMMGRAFGKNLDLGDVAQDLQLSLEQSLGSDRELSQYISLAVQVFCHVVANTVKRKHSNRLDVDLPLALAKFETEMTSSQGGLVKAIAELSTVGVFAQVGVDKALYPLSTSHIKAVTAEARQVVNLRNEYLSYIAQPSVQNAVGLYVSKNPNVPDNVLLPAAIGLATTTPNDAKGVSNAFKTYNDKDVKATFEFYRKAVRSEIDMSTGVNTGDVKAQLRAAELALDAASDSLKLTGLSSSIVSKLKKGFSSVKSEIRSVKPLARTADESIGFATLSLLDLIGGLSNMGTAQVKLNGISGFQTGSGTLINYVLTQIGNQLPSTYDNESIAFLDAQDAIRPRNITTQNLRDVLFAAVQNNLGRVFRILEDAYMAVIPLGTTPQQRGVSPKRSQGY